MAFQSLYDPNFSGYGYSSPTQGHVFGTASAQSQPQVLDTGTQQAAPVPTPAPSGDQGPPQESAPSEPAIDLAALEDAENRIASFETETRSLLSPEGAGEEFQTAAFGRIGEEETRAQEEVTRKKETEAKRGEAAVGEQKRGVSELIRGLAARFGAGISTGLGAQAIVGKEGLRQIGTIRQGLAETMGELTRIGEGFVREFSQQRREVESTVAQIKQQARARLQSALAEIGARRDVLASQKASIVNNALQNYQQQLIDIKARNTAALQAIDLLERQTNERIREAAAKVQQQVQKLPSFSLSPGEIQAIPISEFGGAEQASQFAGTQLPGGATYTPAGEYGIFGVPEKDKDNLGGVP